MKLISVRKLLLGSLLIWFFLTLPVIIVTKKSDFVGFVFKNTVSHWLSKVFKPKFVFIGDSITAGGGISGVLDIDSNPFNDVNIAQSGQEIRQISMSVNRALAYQPEFIVFMGGTNDLANPRLQNQDIIADFSQLISQVRDHESNFIVTLIPYQMEKGNEGRITYLNQQFSKIILSEDAYVIDLNPVIAPSGLLEQKYTVDGVHLNDAAYHVWSEALSEVVKKIESND